MASVGWVREVFFYENEILVSTRSSLEQEIYGKVALRYGDCFELQGVVL